MTRVPDAALAALSLPDAAREASVHRPGGTRAAAVPGAPLAFPDRRGFLRDTAGGTIAIAVASLLPAGCTADYPQAEADGVALSVLTAKEYAVLRAAAEAILTDVPVPAGEVAAEIDRQLAAVGDPVLADLKTVLGLIEHLTIIGLHRGTFTELRPEPRLRYLEGWGRSRLALRRAAYQALRGFVVFFAYVRNETRVLTGFHGPLPEHVRIEATPVDFGDVA
jgi:hypothetical protein